MAKSKENEKIKVLAEALSKVVGMAQELGIEFGNGLNVVDSNMMAVSKGKSETKTAKVAHYSYLLSTGKRQTKADLMKRIL